MNRRTSLLLLLGLLAFYSTGEAQARQARSLFDGRSLGDWEITGFIGRGPVEIHDGALILGAGDPMTGITWKADFPRIGYEVTLEAMRLQGQDFFSAITFPVNDDPCTLVIGGWGGSHVGLSSIDGADASQNETARNLWFDDERWYHIRLRVTEERIQAWIDDNPVVDFSHRGRQLSIRAEVWMNQPFGIATWYTTGALRNLSLRELAPEEAGGPPVPENGARRSIVPPVRVAVANPQGFSQ